MRTSTEPTDLKQQMRIWCLMRTRPVTQQQCVPHLCSSLARILIKFALSERPRRPCFFGSLCRDPCCLLTFLMPNPHVVCSLVAWFSHRQSPTSCPASVKRKQKFDVAANALRVCQVKSWAGFLWNLQGIGNVLALKQHVHKLCCFWRWAANTGQMRDFRGRSQGGARHGPPAGGARVLRLFPKKRRRTRKGKGCWC